MKTTYVSDLKVGDKLETILYVESKKELNYKNKPGSFLVLVLSDKTGSLDGKFWDYDPQENTIGERTFIKCKGEISQYAGSIEIHLQEFEELERSEINPRDFLPSSPYDLEKMIREAVELALSLENTYLKQLLCTFIQNENLFTQFTSAPAAKMHHQAYLGGLLEHSLKTAQIVSTIAAFYPAVNKDLAIAGALLHDIGKIQEYSFDYAIEITDEGRLLGHIVLGLKLVDSLIEKISGFPKELQLALHHILLSHHGRYEWQSPRRPKTIEACLIHNADLIEADLWKFSELKKNYQGESWSPWDKSLERYVYLE